MFDKKMFLVRSFVFTLCLLTVSVSYGQFDKLKKSVSKASSDISKVTSSEYGKKATNAVTPKASEKSSSNSVAETPKVSDQNNYYISPTGKGKEASKSAPAKDIAAIIM